MDLSSYNNFFKQENDEVKDIFRRSLTPGAHADYDKHLIGETLPAPNFVYPLGGTASVGVSPLPAREDHVHAVPQALLFEDGFANDPSIAFIADTDTGIYRPGANQIGFVSNGNERMRVLTSGIAVKGNSAGEVTVGNVTGFASWGGVQGTNGYLLVSRGDANHVYLRTSSASDNLILGVNSTNKLVINNSDNHALTGNLSVSGTLSAGATTVGGLISTAQSVLRRNNSSSLWSNMQIVSQAPTGSVAGISFNVATASIAPVLRVWTSDGERIYAGNTAGTGYIVFGADSFHTVSTKTQKKNIRRRTFDQKCESRQGILGLSTVSFESKHTFSKIVPTKRFSEVNERWTRRGHKPLQLTSDHFNMHQHNCDEEDCVGTSDDPCGLIAYNKNRRGLIAEEVAMEFPHAVSFNKFNQPVGIDYSVITVELIDTIQLMAKELEEIKEKYEDLERKLIGS